MSFRDQWAVDEDGNKYIFTVEMQRQLSEAGLPVEPDSLDELPDAGSESSSSNHSDDTQPETIQIDPQTGKYLGRLKWFDGIKGYGFIARGGGVDIFFHKTETISDPEKLDEGQWVLYDVEEGRKGPEATEVEPYTGELVS